MVSLDERDHALLLSLLEHKVLTTNQIKSLFFRSFRRCQHRMKELRDLDLVASFSVGRGFGEGRPPACWFLTKAGLAEIAKAKDARVSDLPWVPDHGYRSNLLLAHRLGVNAFFCALAEVSRAHDEHCLHTWRPEHWVRTRATEVKPDGFGRYRIPAAHASSTSSTTAARRRSARSPGSSRATCGSRRDGRRSRSSPGSRTSSSSSRRGCAGGRLARPFATRSGACTSADRSLARSRCTWRARSSSSSSACSRQHGSICRPTAIACRSSTSRPGTATSSTPLDASVATSPTPMPATVVGSPPSRPRPSSAPCRPDMLRDAAARRRAKDRA
jgi:Replication-relaxation